MEKEDLQSYRQPFMMGNLGGKRRRVLGYDPINMRWGDGGRHITDNHVSVTTRMESPTWKSLVVVGHFLQDLH